MKQTRGLPTGRTDIKKKQADLMKIHDPKSDNF